MSVTRQTALKVAVLPFALAACFSTSAPRKWLPTAEESQQDAFGAWIRIEQVAEKRPLEGELIAAHAETLFVFADSLVSVRADAVRSVTLTAYDSRYGEIVTWSILGTLATVSHGLVLVLTAPVWIITGTAASASASKAPRVQSRDPVELRKYARFPQGIPAELDRTSILPKPRPAVVRRTR